MVDSGDLISRDMRISDGARPSREAKAALILDAVARTGIDAMTPGDGDLAFGLPWLVERAKALDLPYVCANLVDAEGGHPFDAYRVVEVGEMSIGVFGVTADIEDCDGCDVTDVVPAATDAVAALRGAGVQMVIGLAHMPDADALALAGQLDGVDFIFSGHDRRRSEFPGLAGPTPTYVVRTGSRGREVGRVAIEFVDGARGFYDAAIVERAVSRRQQIEDRVARLEEQLAAAETDRDRQRYERSLDRTRQQLEQFTIAQSTPEGHHTMTIDAVQLGKDVVADPTIDALVQDAKKDMPEEPHKASHDRTRQRQPIGDFAGSNACRSCHQNVYRQWRATTHARAYTTLVKERRHDDDACWRCHVTGAHMEGGPATSGAVGYLRNVQCEACHGASVKHSEDPEVATPMKGKVARTCAQCHNDKAHAGEPKEFDQAAALEQIRCKDEPVEHASTGSRVQLRRDGGGGH